MGSGIQFLLVHKYKISKLYIEFAQISLDKSSKLK